MFQGFFRNLRFDVGGYKINMGSRHTSFNGGRGGPSGNLGIGSDGITGLIGGLFGGLFGGGGNQHAREYDRFPASYRGGDQPAVGPRPRYTGAAATPDNDVPATGGRPVFNPTAAATPAAADTTLPADASKASAEQLQALIATLNDGKAGNDAQSLSALAEFTNNILGDTQGFGAQIGGGSFLSGAASRALQGKTNELIRQAGADGKISNDELKQLALAMRENITPSAIRNGGTPEHGLTQTAGLDLAARDR